MGQATETVMGRKKNEKKKHWCTERSGWPTYLLLHLTGLRSPNHYRSGHAPSSAYCFPLYVYELRCAYTTLFPLSLGHGQGANLHTISQTLSTPIYTCLYIGYILHHPITLFSLHRHECLPRILQRYFVNTSRFRDSTHATTHRQPCPSLRALPPSALDIPTPFPFPSALCLSEPSPTTCVDTLAAVAALSTPIRSPSPPGATAVRLPAAAEAAAVPPSPLSSETFASS